MSNEVNNKPTLLNRILQHPLPLIVGVSVFLRIAVAIFMGNTVVELPGIFDQVSYHNLALRVVGGHGFTFGELWWPITPADAPTAHWSFPYTLYLVLVYSIFGPNPLVARIIQAIIVGMLHPYITYRLGEKVFGKSIGLLAAAISAIYIYFFYYGAALMTEPFYITAILFSLYNAIRLAENTDPKQDMRLGAFLGIAIGCTVVLRQVFLLFIPFLFLWIWIARFKTTRKLPLLPSGVSLALIALFILPITFFNYSRFQSFVLLNTNSGYAFFWGNHPVYGDTFIPILSTPEYREMIPPEVRHLDEAALDRELLGRGIQFVMNDPMRYIRLSLSRIAPYFMFWYSSESGMLSNISRIGSFGIFLPFMLYGLWLSIRRLGKGLLTTPAGLLMLFSVVYAGVHILTWTLVRYRLPIDAVWVLFAGLTFYELAQKISGANPNSRMQFVWNSMKNGMLFKGLLLLVLVAVCLGYSLPWMVVNSYINDHSGIDFHGYWYAGHYLRAGVNPYAAVLDDDPYPIYWDPRVPGSGIPYRLGELGNFETALVLPIDYVDGGSVTEYPVAQRLIVAPAATAPLGLFISLFSWLSWDNARNLWFVLNLIFAVLIPWLTFRLIPDHKKISLLDKLLIAFVFYNLYGLRQTTTVGQQTLISLFALVLALVLRDRWVIAGILLGFGISKYSVGLPVFLYFLLQKQYRTVLVSLVIQGLAVLFFLPLELGSVFATIKAYFTAIGLNYSQSGVHLGARLPDSLIIYVPILAVLVGMSMLIRQSYLHAQRYPNSAALLGLNDLSLLVSGIFLAVYHRIHDMPFVIFFMVIVPAFLIQSIAISKSTRLWLTLTQLGLLVLLIFPTVPMKIISILGVPANIAALHFGEDAMSTIALLFMFGISAWFQKQITTEANISVERTAQPA